MEKYDILKLIGQGTYGKALLCFRKGDNVKCVIKQITTTHLSKKELAATEQESELLKRMSHPNIVAFYETFYSSNTINIVMEYADGGDLDKYLKNRKYQGNRYLSESEALRIFIQISLAIKHIHDRKILHRDLKAQVMSSELTI